MGVWHWHNAFHFHALSMIFALFFSVTCCSKYRERSAKEVRVRKEDTMGLFSGHSPVKSWVAVARSWAKRDSDRDGIFSPMDPHDFVVAADKTISLHWWKQHSIKNQLPHVIITIQPPHRSRHLPTPPPPLRHPPRPSPRLHQANPRRRRIPQRRSRPPPRRILRRLGGRPRHRLLQ